MAHGEAKYEYDCSAHNNDGRPVKVPMRALRGLRVATVESIQIHFRQVRDQRVKVKLEAGMRRVEIRNYDRMVRDGRRLLKGREKIYTQELHLN